MSGKAVAIGMFVALVVGSGVFVATQEDEAPKEAASTPPIAVSTPATNSTQPANKVAGSFVDYRDGILQQSSGQRVLFFHAPWCPQCRSIEKGIKEDGVPDGFTVIKVDYDSNQELRKKYGVTIQTTFVKVDAQGNGTGTYVAYEEPTFSAVKRNFLK